MGWIHKCGSKSIQIRSKKGGGTRKLTLSKDATTRKDLLDMGKMLFFLNGESSKGSQNDFEFEVWDIYFFSFPYKIFKNWFVHLGFDPGAFGFWCRAQAVFTIRSSIYITLSYK